LPHPHHQQPPTVAILGANTLLDRILALLLKDEGYDTKLLEAYPTGLRNELLSRVDVLLLSPYLDTDVRWAFLEAMRSTPEEAQRIPVLSLSVPLLMALQDELSINVSWQSLFEGLVQELEAALLAEAEARAEASAEALPVDSGERPKESSPRYCETACA
jgi:hypothetical protein